MAYSGYHHFGPTLKALIRQQGLTQDLVCADIMERSNLNRVLNGKQNISRDNLTTLLERIGFSANQFFPHPLTLEEIEVQRLCDEADTALADGDIAGAQKILNVMEDLAEFTAGLAKRNKLKLRATIALEHSNISAEEYSSIYKTLDEAIKITLPLFEEKLIQEYLLSVAEIEILCAMATVHAKKGDMEYAATMTGRIAKAIRNNYVNNNTKARVLSLVLSTRTTFTGLLGWHAQALVDCDEAIAIATENRIFELLPKLKIFKACAMYYLDNAADIKNLVLEAYYGNKIMSRTTEAQLIKEYAVENLNISVEIFP